MIYLVNLISLRTKISNKLTISPFGNSGGNQDMIIFVLEAGIALMACGADGTIYGLENIKH